MGKRCICIALVMILVITIGLAPLAQPAEAVAGVVVAGAVVAVMAMAGITIITSGMTAAQIQDWVEDKLEEWAADVGSPLDHLINSAGIGVTISGLLTIGTAAAQGINQFINWLKADTGLTDNSQQSVIIGGSTFGPYKGVVTNHVEWIVGGNSYVFNISIPVFVAYLHDSSRGWYVCGFLSNNAFAVNGSGAWYDTQGQYYFYRFEQAYITMPSSTNPSLIWNEGDYQDLFVYARGHSLNLNTSGSLDLDAGVINLPQVQNDDKVFLDVGALPGSTVSEVTEGVLTDVETDQLEVSGTVAEEEPEYVITGPVSVSGLDDIFPFCIPFDLYHMCEALAADPVAPHFEWRFYVPRIVDYTIVIDLSGFNTAAEILRIMETLLFCVGLAFETRKLIRS